MHQFHDAAVVVVPVKAFRAAKQRLAGILDEAQRAELARSMADRVVAAAAPLPVVVACDDDVVAAWADGHGATVVRVDGHGLNGTIEECVRHLTTAGVRRVVVAHADLPFADDLTGLAEVAANEVLLVPDRHGDGTNVVSVPTGQGFRFRYGHGSFEAHRAEAAAIGLDVRVLRSERLGWDVDEPSDLDPPRHLGSLPTSTADVTGSRR